MAHELEPQGARTGVRQLEQTDRCSMSERFQDDGKGNVTRTVEMGTSQGSDTFMVDPHMESTKGIKWTKS